MAKNRIDVDVVVDDNGTLKQTAAGARKASKGLDDTAKSAHTADRNLKGAAQASSNSTKNFSKMAQGTGGLVAAYATLAANIFAVSAAYGFLKRAGDVAALTRGQEEYAMKTGRSMTLLTSRIQQATGGILAFNEASQAAAIGAAAGLSNEQLTGLARVAKNASVSLGRDLTDAFNRLTRGAIKAEPELLDELGIIIRLDKVTKDYSRTLGKNAKDLTQFEKSQAVVNAVLEQGIQKFDDVGNNVNQIARLGKGFTDLVKDIQEMIEPLVSFLGKTLADNVHGLAAAFGVLGLSITRSMLPAMPVLGGMEESVAAAKSHLQASAMTGPSAGVAAGKIAEGNFDRQTLNAIGFAAGASKSTVLDVTKTTEAQTKRSLAILRADHALTMAKNSTGVKKYGLVWKATLAKLELEHGKTMGRLKMAQLTVMTALNKALSAVAFIGMLYTAITLVSALMQKLRDPAIVRLEEKADELKETFQEQNLEITNLIDNLKEAESPMATLLQQAEVLNNFEFDGMIGMADAIQKASTKGHHSGKGGTIQIMDKSNIQANEEMEDAIVSVIDLLNTQQKAFEKFDVKPKGIEEFRKELELVTSATGTLARIDLEDQLSNYGLTAQELGEAQAIGLNVAEYAARKYNGALAVIQEGYDNVVKKGREFNRVLSPQEMALKSITETAEAFNKFQQTIGLANSKFSNHISLIKTYSDTLTTLTGMGDNTTMETFFNPDKDSKGAAQLAAFSDALGITMDQIRKMTKLEVIGLLDNTRLGILNAEYAIKEKTLKSETKFIALTRGRSALQVAELQRHREVQKIQEQIETQQNNLLYILNNAEQFDETAINNARLKLGVLKEQLVTAERLTDENARMRDVAQGGFESSATKNIADLIKGEESSFKDAFLKIGKGMLDAVADEAAARMSKGLTDLIFGPSEEQQLKIETSKNTEAVKNLTKTIDNKIDSLIDEKKLEKDRINEGVDTSTINEDKGIAGKISEFKDKPLKEKFKTIKDKSLGFLEKIGEGFTNLGGFLVDSFTSLKNFIFGEGGIFSQFKNLGKEFLGIGTGQKNAGENSINLQPELGEKGSGSNGIAEVIVEGEKSEGLKGIFDGFMGNLESIFQGDVPFLRGLKNIFTDGLTGFGGIFKNLGSSLMSILGNVGGGLLSIFGFANGGIAKGGFRSAAYADGGVIKRPTVGLIGEGRYNEAVVPLPDGKKIPVEMGGMNNTNQNNSVVVNISSDGKTQSNGNIPDMEKLGEKVAIAVQQELQTQKRSGGILNPYGAS